MTNANIEIIREGYQSYARRDFAAVFAVLAPEIEIYQTELLPWGGTYHGLQQAQEFFRKLNQYTDGSPEPHEYIAAGDDVVAIGRLRGTVRSTGRKFDMAIVHIWTVKDGRVTRFAAYIDTPAMLAALDGTD